MTSESEGQHPVDDFLTPPARGSLLDMFKLAWWAFRTHPLINSLSLFSDLIRNSIPAAEAWIAKLIIDRVVLALSESQTLAEAFPGILSLILLEFAVVFANHLFSEIVDYFAGYSRDSYDIAANEKLMRKSMSLDMAYFEYPAFLSRFEYMKMTLTETPKHALDWIQSTVMGLWGILIFIPLLLRFDWPVMALVVIAPMIITVLEIISQRHFRNRREVHWKVDWRAREMTWISYQSANAKEVRTFSLADWIIEQFRLSRSKSVQYDQRTNLIGLGWNAISELITRVSYYAAYGLTIIQVLVSKLSLGDLTLMLQSIRSLSRSINNLFRSVSNLFKTLEEVGEYSVFFSLKPFTTSASDAEQSLLPGGEIRFENVWFRYRENRDWALKDISLTIRPGDHLAIVGENGSGKTTLTKLLLRLYDPVKGRILYNGEDIRKWDIDVWRRQFSAIFQDWVQYDLSMAENVEISDPERRDRTRLEYAASQSGVDKLLPSLPGGFETQLGRSGPYRDEATNLSVGQWQKVALARAFYRDAPILILDEPTASVDARSEYELYRLFRDGVEQRTLVLISHRFSSVRIADRIIVMEAGRLVEQGTHRELLKMKGLYAEMFALQMEGLTEEEPE